MKSKIKNIFIILSVLSLLSLSGGSKVYAEDTDAEEPVTGQSGEYTYTVIEHYDDQWPEGVTINIEYERYNDYPTWPHYVVNLNGDRQRVYQGPSKYSNGIDSLYYGERCKVLELIQNEEGEFWYMFVTKVEGQDYIAFIQTDKVEKREFRLEDMYEHVQALAGFGSLGPVVYINNYRNLSGIPPELASGEYYDPYGYRRGQSAPGYYNSSLLGDFRYIPDGALCIIEEVIDITEIEQNSVMFNSLGEFVPSSGGIEGVDSHTPESIMQTIQEYNANSVPYVTKVYVPSFGVSLYIDSVYIDMEKMMQGGFGQAVVVDRANQNSAVFEYDNGWQIISISYVTTGKSSETAVPTPLGYFMAIEQKDIFEYEEEGGDENEGFAPYAIRFSGGGYLHGVPMKYEFDSEGNRKPVYTYTESILSIGTVPESHMCIRNFTSHAKFMYDWIVIGSCSVIVFE